MHCMKYIIKGKEVKEVDAQHSAVQFLSLVTYLGRNISWTLISWRPQYDLCSCLELIYSA